MKNRNVEFFNLSFLDLLSGALAAIIFLFIIVPKGNISLNAAPVEVTYDTIQQTFSGAIPASFLGKGTGDTLLAIVGRVEGKTVEKKTDPQPKEVVASLRQPVQRRPSAPKPEKKTPEKEREPEVSEKPSVPANTMEGSRPDVPCVVSIEMKWGNKKDNIDLFVCKDNACVFGGKRHRDFIGFWDSGKSKTSLFGGDLRTNQEAVRQFDEIIPGTYNILAQYKESEDPKDEIPVRLQVYTRNSEKVERGKEHLFDLELNPNQRTRIAQVRISPEGEIEFQSFK